MQAVQSLDNGVAPVGDGPYLVAVVNHHLSDSFCRLFKVVVLHLLHRLDILPYALSHRGGPHPSVLIDGDTGNCRMDIQGQFLKCLFVEGEEKHSFFRTHIDAIIVGHHRRDILVDAQFGDAERHDAGTVVTA